MKKRRNIHRSAAFSFLAVLAVLASWKSAAAGPITNGPGVAPFVKLGVYQGVISVVPGGITDSLMEIGNAGRDIASTGAIYLRPGVVGGQGGNIVIAAQATPDEGGEILLQGAGSYQSWAVDLWRNRFRVHTNGVERLTIDGTAGGNIYVPVGAICYGNVGSTNCLTVGGAASTPTLDAVLGAGNNSTRSAALGAAITPLSKLVVNNGLSLTGSALDGISTYANSNGSAIYAQQTAAGGNSYAGYFSGRVNITGDLIYKNRLKPTPGIQVCEIGTDNCLGQYLWTLNPNATTAQYCYYTGTGVAVPSTCVNVFSSAIVPDCAGTNVLVQRSPSATSYFSQASCAAQEYVVGNGPPQGAAGTYACLTGTTAAGYLPTSKNVAGVCQNNLTSGTYRFVGGTINSTVYTAEYELR